MKVKYLGPSPSVILAATGQECFRGEASDVPDEIGVQLVEQGWKETKDKAAKADSLTGLGG